LENLSKWEKNKGNLNMIQAFSRLGNQTILKLLKVVYNTIFNSVNFKGSLSLSQKS
jgi:hypothetical protein